MTTFLQLMLTGLTVGAIYALIAVGFVMIYKASGVFNFAQGELVMVGAFLGWTFLVAFDLPIWLGFILTFVCAGLLGMFIERFALRPMIGQPLLALVMMTIALSSFLVASSQLAWTVWGKSFTGVLPVEKMLNFGDLHLPQTSAFGFLAAIALVGIFTWFFRSTRAGLAMRATAEDHQSAHSCGISVKGIFTQSWVIAALVSAVGGVVLGCVSGVNLGLAAMGIKAIPVVLLGGLESIPGAIVAGLLMGVLESLASGYKNPMVGGGRESVFESLNLGPCIR